MKHTFLAGILYIIATHIYDCTSTKKNNVISPAERRQLLLKKVVSKINELSLYSFHNTSLEDTPQKLKNIEEQLKLASKFTGQRSNRYVGLLMDGIQSIVASKNKFGEIETANVIESDIRNSVNQNLQINFDAYDDYEQVSAESAEIKDDTCDCSCVEENLCLNISSLNTFTCRYYQNEISLAQMCDGQNDCVDNSDENECILLANKKLSDAKRIIKNIKKILPKHCLEVQNSVDKVVMKTRNQTLSKVVNNQFEMINKVAPIMLHWKKEKINSKVREIVQQVSSVEAALEGALCIREKYKIDIRRRNGISLNEASDMKKKTWAPPLCKCSGKYCLQSNCTSACNNTCWQRHSLVQWQCQTIVNVTGTVPFDVLCDGKVDCFDESDEKGCTAGAGADKFKATQIYNSIIELLGTEKYSVQINKVINLKYAVKKLQAQSTRDEMDTGAISSLRDEAFSGLLSIYDNVLTTAGEMLEVDAAYNSLMTVSQELVKALKLSKTGNGRFVSPNKCHCVADKCMLTECTVACVRFCAIKGVIIEYSCNSNSSIRIPMQALCNGIVDCPGGDDEKNCHTDVCRNHHLLVLRNRIQDYKSERWGHALSEILDSWKTKTMTSIQLIEKTERLTPEGMQRVLLVLLYDLAQAYSTLPSLTRRSTEGTMPAFLELAGLIKDSAKDCI